MMSGHRRRRSRQQHSIGRRRRRLPVMSPTLNRRRRSRFADALPLPSSLPFHHILTADDHHSQLIRRGLRAAIVAQHAYDDMTVHDAGPLALSLDLHFDRLTVVVFDLAQQLKPILSHTIDFDGVLSSFQ